jgi:hypothetical protein
MLPDGYILRKDYTRLFTGIFFELLCFMIFLMSSADISTRKNAIASTRSNNLPASYYTGRCSVIY